MDLFGDLPAAKNNPTTQQISTTASGSALAEEPATKKIKVGPETKTAAGEAADTQSQYRCDFIGVTAHHQGCRLTYEDTEVILPDLRDACPELPERNQYAYFALFDGHGGTHAAEFCKENLHIKIAACLGSTTEKNEVRKAIINGFKQTNEAFVQKATVEKWRDGCTAVVLLVINNLAYIANLGDSRALLCRAGPRENAGTSDTSSSPKFRSIPLTKDHKPIILKERERIEKAGGYVDGDGRVNGMLEVARSIGDAELKPYGVIASPDVMFVRLNGTEEFILLACDGLWAVFTSAEAVEYVQQRMSESAAPKGDKVWTGTRWVDPKPPELSEVALSACKKLIKEAVGIEKRGKDNTTAVLVVPY